MTEPRQPTPQRHERRQLCPRCGGRDLRAYKRRYYPPRREVHYCHCYECGQAVTIVITWGQEGLYPPAGTSPSDSE